MSERFRSFGFDLNSLSVKEEKLNLSQISTKNLISLIKVRL